MKKFMQIAFWGFAWGASTITTFSRISEKGVYKANMFDQLLVFFNIAFLVLLVGFYLGFQFGRKEK